MISLYFFFMYTNNYFGIFKINVGISFLIMFDQTSKPLFIFALFKYILRS